MSNRKIEEARAIEASRTHTEEPKKRPPRRERSMAALYTSWGALDCDFYFRWAEAAIGFRAQAMEPQAETIGRRLVPFWDDAEAGRMKARYQLTPEVLALVKAWEQANLLGANVVAEEDFAADQAKRHYGLDPAMRALCETMELVPGPAARPVHGRQGRVITQPDKTTDEHLDAVRRYRRIDRGMAILRLIEPVHFAVLHHVFLPRRNPPEIELMFGQLSDLVIRLDRVTGSHAAAMAQEDIGERVSLETWLLRRIEKRDAIVDLALADAQQMALSAVRAFEEVTEAPREVREASADREPKRRAVRQMSIAASETFLMAEVAEVPEAAELPEVDVK